jgi:uncharacterized membrane protein (DUF106 family)
MGLFNFIDPVMDTVLNPLLGFGYFWGICIVALVISLLITLVYKYTTDQKRIKEIRESMKSMQKELMQLSKEDPEKAKEKRGDMMKYNKEMMIHSMKSSLYTIIPILIIFGWLAGNLAFLPLMPGQAFNATLDVHDVNGEATITLPEGLTLVEGQETMPVQNDKVQWTVQGEKPGKYTLTFDVEDTLYSKDIIITKTKKYISPIKRKSGFFDGIYAREDEYLTNNEFVQQIVIGNKEVKPMGNFSIFGWHPGWFGAYILLSIVFSIVLRKVLRVY